MEPLAALGLAANIAQFVDFSLKLTSTTEQISAGGKSISVAHLTTITNDLVDFNSSLKKKVGCRNFPKRAFHQGGTSECFNVSRPWYSKFLKSDQQSLITLIDDCQDQAKEFIKALNQVTKNPSERRSRWGNVRGALATVWKKERFELFARQLGEYRVQVALRLLDVINNKLTLLHEDNKEIVEIISINCGALQSAFDGYYEGKEARQQTKTAEAERRHAETIAAILTNQNGNSTAITSSNYLLERPSPPARPDTTCTTTTYRKVVGEKDYGDFETTEYISFTRRVRDALHFCTINSRRDAILQAHKDTFQWIYRDTQSHDKPWNNFSEWLRSGRGCYWINGKAGSGKSTLMKFLHEDRRTYEALQEWAAVKGNSELVVGSFFFWYAGTSPQKSQAGLLRSLLLDVLSRRPELTPVLFPDLCRSILSKQSTEGIELSFIELRKAFTTFVTSVPKGLKVFFMVDGIDEYEGDHNDISELFSQATGSDSVKILLSSRPIPACVQAFSTCHTLRLQDLTRKDVRNYVQEKLGRNPLMQKLEVADKGATRQLIDNITSKASGVLLWVVLVVRSLIRGLQDYDTTEDLFQKLDELPPDLERLYDHMLGSMSPQNRRQGSKLLQLVLRSTETDESFRMTLLQLSFAEDEDDKKSVKAPISALSTQEEEWRCESIEGRMRSRCCGLIEARNDHFFPGATRPGTVVDFLHRTVVEFLRTNTIWVQIVSLTNGTKFDVNMALVSSSLAEMKAKPPTPENKDEVSPAYYSMLRMLTYERHMEDVRDVFHSLYLPELKKTMSNYWHHPELFESPAIETQAMMGATARGCNRLGILYPESFLLFAASHCPKTHLDGLIYCHVPEPIEMPPSSSGTEDLRDMLQAYILIQYMDEVQIPLRLALSRSIAANCGSPNRPVPVQSRRIWNSRWKEAVPVDGDWSLWEAALHHTYTLTSMDSKEMFKFVHTGLAEAQLTIIFGMLQAGAHVSQIITLMPKDYASSKT